MEEERDEMEADRMQENGGLSDASQEYSPAWSSSGEQGYEGDTENGYEDEVEYEVSLVFRSSVPGVRRAPAIISARILDPRRRCAQRAIEKAIRRGPREVLDAKALILGLEEAIKQGIMELHVITHNRALFNHVNGRWVVRWRSKIGPLVRKVVSLRNRFHLCPFFLVPERELIKAFQ